MKQYADIVKVYTSLPEIQDMIILARINETNHDKSTYMIFRIISHVLQEWEVNITYVNEEEKT